MQIKDNSKANSATAVMGKKSTGHGQFFKLVYSGDYYTTYSKPGWGCFSSSYGGPVLNDAGIVMKKGHPYMLAVLTSSYNRTSDMTRLMRLID